MRNGLVLFSSDRGITPAGLARAAEERGFDTFYVPEHTHIPVRRTAAHPGTGDESLPDDRYTRTLDPWISLATAAAVTTRIGLSTAVALPVESDPITLAKAIATLDHLSRRPGHDRRRLRLEHRRARGPPRPCGQAPHRAPRVRRGDARAVDPGGGGVRRRVRVVRTVLGLPQAGPGPHPADHRRRRRPQDLPVDRPARRRLDDHAHPDRHQRPDRGPQDRLDRGGPRRASPTSGC